MDNHEEQPFISIMGEMGTNLFRQPFSDITLRRQKEMVLTTSVLALLVFGVVELQSGAIQGLTLNIKNTNWFLLFLVVFSCALLIRFLISSIHDLVFDKYDKLSSISKMRSILDKFSIENKAEFKQLGENLETELNKNDEIVGMHQRISQKIQEDIDNLIREAEQAMKKGKRSEAILLWEKIGELYERQENDINNYQMALNETAERRNIKNKLDPIYTGELERIRINRSMAMQYLVSFSRKWLKIRILSEIAFPVAFFVFVIIYIVMSS